MSINGKLPIKMMNPLAGRKILVTRAADQAAEFADQLRQRGAVVVECPTIQLVPPQQWDNVDAAILTLSSFDWLILTSVNGVRFFFDRLQDLEIKLQQTCKVCAVGPKTAALLADMGIEPALIPETFTGEGIVSAFQELELKGKKILFPKADGARDLIPQQLAQLGAAVIDPVVYRNIMPTTLPDAARQALEQRQLDAAVFSSPSTVRNLATLLGGAEQLRTTLDQVAVASIGPVTSKACRELGLKVTLEPEQATLDDLLIELEHHFSDQ